MITITKIAQDLLVLIPQIRKKAVQLKIKTFKLGFDLQLILDITKKYTYNNTTVLL